jgi:hypothetical protein
MTEGMSAEYHKNAPINLLSGDEPWEENLDRMGQPGRLTRIDGETYRNFLEVLPPHYQGDDFFAFAEGREPLRLFCRFPVQHFCRQLTWEESREFCAAAGIDLPQ